MTSNLITSTDASGNTHTFSYTIENNYYLSNKIQWRCRITAIPRSDSQDFFELALEEVDEDTVKIVFISHHNEPAYKEKGIPDTVLPMMRDYLKKSIISSTSTSKNKDEYRTEKATRMWERLRRKNIAIYLEDLDIYKIY